MPKLEVPVRRTENLNAKKANAKFIYICHLRFGNLVFPLCERAR